jgi:uracil-DNA glycosylase
MLLNLTDIVSTKPTTAVSRCGGACKLCEGCKAALEPRKGKNGILLVFEQPTEQEDAFQQIALGNASLRVKAVLNSAGVDMDECSIAYAICCHSGDIETKVYDNAIDSCRMKLVQFIEDTKPTTILLFGHAAISSIIAYDYGKAAGATDTWVGWKIPSRKFNAWLCPIYGITLPFAFNDPAMDLLYAKYITEAVAKKARPWKTIPDEAKEIEILYDDAQVVERLHKYWEKGGTVAWDLETSGLKPDSKEQFIYSCSVCWMDKETMSFLWNDVVAEGMRKLLQSGRTSKIGANCKFEHRWAMAKMGIDVKGWTYDLVLAQHVLDCRPNITSLKFQSYVRFGLPDYDSHIKKFFESGGSNSLNKIKECDVHSLLLYGGIDALLTYRVSVQQMREMGHPFVYGTDEL